MLKIVLSCFVLHIGIAVGIPQEVIEGSNKFSINFKEEVNKMSPGNSVLSGYSLQTILVLDLIGARGETSRELREALGIKHAGKQFICDHHKVKIAREKIQGASISLKNTFYKNDDIKLNPSFHEALKKFKVEVKSLDYSGFGPSETDAATFNQTFHKLNEEDNDNETFLMLVKNQFNFNGQFENEFDPDDTKQRDFHLCEDETVKVDTMRSTGKILYLRSDEHRATILDLPIKGTDGRVFFSIALPDKVDGVTDLLQNGKEFLMSKNRTEIYATVYLPKFSLNSSMFVTSALENLGIKTLFKDADLSDMSNAKLDVESMNQDVSIRVCEQGILASSEARETLIQPKKLSSNTKAPHKFMVDRPFLFNLNIDGIIYIDGVLSNPLESA